MNFKKRILSVYVYRAMRVVCVWNTYNTERDKLSENSTPVNLPGHLFILKYIGGGPPLVILDVLTNL